MLLTTGPTVIPVWYVVTLYKQCIIIIILLRVRPLNGNRGRVTI